jgi:hypothetical protein
MTPAQKRALRPYRKQLKLAFAEAAANATKPGRARNWFVPFLANVLDVYRRLGSEVVDGRSLRRALSKDPKAALRRLLRVSKRDVKTLSRWAAALVNAVQSKISPEDLPKWLSRSGGVSGRARELAKKKSENISPTGTPAWPPRPTEKPALQSWKVDPA